jgi:hypothetical protein
VAGRNPSLARLAGKEMVADNMMMIASALAYASFFAMPSVLLFSVMQTWLPHRLVSSSAGRLVEHRPCWV